MQLQQTVLVLHMVHMFHLLLHLPEHKHVLILPATNFGGPLPCIPPVQVCTDPIATNYNVSYPCQYPQPLSAQTLSATNVMDTAAQIRGSYTGGVAASMRFKYGTTTPPTIGVTAYGNSISYTTYLTNLMPNTTYFYQACVTNNANVEFCGQTLSFTTTGTIIPQGQAPVAITQNAQLNGTIAMFSGFVDMMQGTNGTYRFEYGTSPSFGMSSQTMQTSGATTVSASAQNLIPNTMYYYRIVAQNNYGVTNGNTLTFTTTGGPICGTNQTFGTTSNGLIWNAFGSGTINQTTQIPCNPNPNPCGTNVCPPPTPQPTQGSVITTVATNIAQSTAQLNAIARNVNGTVAFEYGFSASQLGYTTQPQTINNAGGISFYDTVYNLEPNTTYYFRAFTQTNGAIIRGDIISFRTKSIKDPKVVVINNGTGTGTAATAVMVKIENTYKNACVDDMIDYTITYKNTTTKTLKNVALVVTLPGELEFARATKVLTVSVTTHLLSLSTLLAQKKQTPSMYKLVHLKYDKEWLRPQQCHTHFHQVLKNKQLHTTSLIKVLVQITETDSVQLHSSDSISSLQHLLDG